MNRSLTLMALALALAACAGTGSSSTSPNQTTEGVSGTSTLAAAPATLPAPTTVPSKSPNTSPITVPSEPGPIDTGLAPLIDLAIADLADRLDVAPDEISAVRGELVVWPDTSLGCPEPDMSYAQVPSDGSVIILDHAGDLYRYHTGGESLEPFLCEHPA